MNRFLFLCAWIHGSDSSFGLPETHVHKQEDLLKQWQANNDQVLAVVVSNASNGAIAEALGCREAFYQNYTAHDSLSQVIELDLEEFVNLRMGAHTKIVSAD